jgi:predicted MFS family arabinose efflux permease
VTAHLLLLGLVDRGGNSTERGVEEMTGDFASTAIQRRCALICMFVGFLFYTGLNGTLWPNLAKESGLSSTMVGIGACCAIIQIPALALLWAKLARRVRSPWLIIGMLFVVGLSGLSMPFVSGWPAHFLIMVCVGAGYSCLIYHGLFYANSDPVSRERSLGIVESTVGLGSLVGPTLMGVLAWDSGANRLPYVVGFCMVLVTCVVVAIMWRNATRASDG